jgi:hypothetical protein
MSASIYIAARFGGTPRCIGTTAVATARPHPRGKPAGKGSSKRCRPVSVAPVPIGR